MRLLIIEDEEDAVLRLQKLIKKVKPEAEIIGSLDSVQDSVSWLQDNPLPDLIFMDIQLSDGISFSIFDEIQNITCPVIFTTAYDEYAVKAFEVNSIDYLLKPVNEEKLARSFEKYDLLLQNVTPENHFSRQFTSFLTTMNQYNPKYKTRFLIKKIDSMVVVPVDDIAWFFADNKEVVLTTKNNQRHIISESLERIEKQLDPKEFHRINRQYIVSVHSIKNISNYFNYKLKIRLEPPTDKEIILGRKKVAEFKTWLAG